MSLWLVFVLIACGSEQATQSPNTPQSLPTPTPRSTPLPEVATPALLGTEARPIRLVFVLTELDSDSQQAARDLATQLTEQLQNERLSYLGVTMVAEVDTLPTMQAGLDVVCGGEGAMAWVDAFTYIAAEQLCGAQPLFTIHKSSREEVAGLPNNVTLDAETGLTFDLVYARRLGSMSGGLTEIAGKVVCRLSADDPFWIHLNLTLRGVGINPITDLGGIVDVEDYEALIRAIVSEDEQLCDLGAIPHGTLAGIVRALGNDRSNPLDIDLQADDSPVRLLEETWPEVPYAVLITPPENVLPSDLRESVAEALQELTGDPELDNNLQILLNYEDIRAVSAADFGSFREWLQAAGWEMGH